MRSKCGKMATSTGSKDAAGRTLLQEQIRAQGEVVRQMKKDKKAKEEVRQQAKNQGLNSAPLPSSRSRTCNASRITSLVHHEAAQLAEDYYL